LVKKSVLRCKIASVTVHALHTVNTYTYDEDSDIFNTDLTQLKKLTTD